MNTSKKETQPILLVAEDDPDDRILLEVILGGFKDECEIHFIEDREELMEYLHHQTRPRTDMPSHPALILLDLTMTNEESLDTLSEIRKCKDTRETPVVVLTSSKFEEDRVLSSEAGADYLPKPTSFVAMETAINEIIRTWLLHITN